MFNSSTLLHIVKHFAQEPYSLQQYLLIIFLVLVSCAIPEKINLVSFFVHALVARGKSHYKSGTQYVILLMFHY